jgi:HopA1 effector protein family
MKAKSKPKKAKPRTASRPAAASSSSASAAASAADALRPVLRAVELLSPTAFRLQGHVYERAPATPAEAAQAQGSGSILVPLLQDALYGAAYVRPFGGPGPTGVAGPGDDLLPALVAAHPGREGWEGGWEVKQAVSTGRVLAERYGEARFFFPGEFLAEDGPGMPPRKGLRARVWRPRESATLQPGFYFAFGAAGTGDEGTLLLRFYWNVTPEGAPALLAAVAGTMDRWGVPFRFKVLSRRALYPRVDSAVLYVPRRWWRLARELALEVRERVAAGLGEGTPLFALPLAPGLAMAEDPGTGDSFGQSRCRLVAEGVWDAWRAGFTAEGPRLAAVAEAFRRAGLDLARPWAGAGSRVRYEEAGDE